MTNEEFIKSITVEGEEWKDVIGFEGYYMVSNLGKVISLGRPVTNHLGTRHQEPHIVSFCIAGAGVPFPSTEPAFETIGEPDNVFILVPVNTTITNRACLPVYPVDQIVIP